MVKIKVVYCSVWIGHVEIDSMVTIGYPSMICGVFCVEGNIGSFIRYC